MEIISVEFAQINATKKSQFSYSSSWFRSEISISLLCKIDEFSLMCERSVFLLQDNLFNNRC